VAYDYFDRAKGLTRFTVCVPVGEEVYIQPGSDLKSGKLAGFHAVRTTLTGDYSHLGEAWDKTFAHIDKNKLIEADSPYLEVYQTGKEQVRSPSKWVTEIYVPVGYTAPPPAPVPLPVPSTPMQTHDARPEPASGDSPDGEISIP
jgi:hypothetical protein